MSSRDTKKLNHLMRVWPRGVVGVQAWLESMGIYRQLADRYCASQWLERVGHGAYKLIDDHVDWTGAVYALEYELQYQMHVGAITALELQGYSHFIPLGREGRLFLFKQADEKRLLPKWFVENFAKIHDVYYLTRELFDETVGIFEYSLNDYKLQISSAERALFECIELVPKYITLEHCLLLIQGMTTLRPKLLQQLLENCRSIKAKRLFLLLAEHENHRWFSRLDISKIDLGKGKRIIGKGGHFYPKYNLSLSIILNEKKGYSDNGTEI